MYRLSVVIDSGDLELNSLCLDLFDDRKSTNSDESMLEARIGAQKCLLYRIDETLKPASFTEIYRRYRSEMGKLKSYPNPLQGLTEAPEDMQEEASLPDFQYFLCEQYDYELWEGKALLPTLCQVASEI